MNIIKKLESHNFKNIENLNEIKGDISSRKYYRFRSKNKPLILCVNDKFNKKHNEEFVYWNNKYLEGDILVPEIKYYEKGFIVQEEITETFYSLLGSKNLSEYIDIYKNALDTLVKIHMLPKDLYKEYQCLDKGRFINEFENTKKYFKHLDLQLFKKVIINNLNYDFLISHRDFHSRNLMVKEEKVYVIDYQDTMLGSPLYDLCSILNDCYIDLDADIKIELLNYYYNKTWKRMHNLSYKEFRRQFDLYSLQRITKAIGNFASTQSIFFRNFIKSSVKKCLVITKKNEDLKKLTPFYMEILNG